MLKGPLDFSAALFHSRIGDDASDLLLHHLELFFLCPTFGTYPAVRKILERRAGIDTVIRVSDLWIVDIPAYHAFPFFHRTLLLRIGLGSYGVNDEGNISVLSQKVKNMTAMTAMKNGLM